MLHHECDCNSCTTIPLNAAKDMKLFGCWRGFPAWTISGASKELEFSAIWSQSMHGTKSLALGTTPDSLSFVLMRGSSSRRHGSGHSCIKEKQKHHHLQFSRLRRQGKGKKKNQSHSLKNFSNGPWLFSSHWQSIVQYAGWATRWKQVVNISFSTAVGQTSLLKLTLAITGYKWQSVDLKPVTLLLLLKLLLLQLLNCTVEQGISLNLKLKTNHLEHHLVLKSPKTWIMEVPGDLYFLYSLY